MTMSETASSPDQNAGGLTETQVDPSRYDWAIYDPFAVTGLMHGMMPGNVRVLDIGCAGGMVTLFANRDRGNEIVAVEPDVERAAVARERGLNVYDRILDKDLQKELGLFDVVMMSDVLEHIAAPGDFLELVKGSLKPGGTLLLSVPNVAHWSVRWMLLRGRFDYQPFGIMDATHLRWFTAESLRALLTASGFDTVEMRHSIGVSMPPNSRNPLKLLKAKLRRWALIRRTQWLPKLFGIQHVVKATLRA
jgi:SAM-dependent methyltransferase